MTSISRKESKKLEELYLKVFQEQEEETEEGDTISKAANITKQVGDMEKRGEKIDPKLQQAKKAAEDEITQATNEFKKD